MIKFLTTCYKEFNRGLFRSKLPSVDFIENFSRKNIFHFRTPNIIEIGSLFSQSSSREILDDLLHCMIHHENHVKGIQDVTQNQYHKLEFCESALRCGLIVICHKTRGWGKTTSDPKLIEHEDNVRKPESSSVKKRREVYNKIVFPKSDLIAYQEASFTQLTSKPTKTFTFKYVCACDPPIIVRVGKKPDGPRPFKAKCKYCNEQFLLDET